MIGIARQESFDPRWESITSTYAHAELRKRIARTHGVVLRVFGRLTDAGCKVDEFSEAGNECDLTPIPDGWIPERIVDLFFGLTQPPRSADYQLSAKEFRKTVEKVSKVTDRHQYNVNDAANSGIVARLVSFRAKGS